MAAPGAGQPARATLRPAGRGDAPALQLAGDQPPFVRGALLGSTPHGGQGARSPTVTGAARPNSGPGGVGHTCPPVAPGSVRLLQGGEAPPGSPAPEPPQKAPLRFPAASSVRPCCSCPRPVCRGEYKRCRQWHGVALAPGSWDAREGLNLVGRLLVALGRADRKCRGPGATSRDPRPGGLEWMYGPYKGLEESAGAEAGGRAGGPGPRGTLGCVGAGQGQDAHGDTRPHYMLPHTAEAAVPPSPQPTSRRWGCHRQPWVREVPQPQPRGSRGSGQPCASHGAPSTRGPAHPHTATRVAVAPGAAGRGLADGSTAPCSSGRVPLVLPGRAASEERALCGVTGVAPAQDGLCWEGCSRAGGGGTLAQEALGDPGDRVQLATQVANPEGAAGRPDGGARCRRCAAAALKRVRPGQGSRRRLTGRPSPSPPSPVPPEPRAPSQMSSASSVPSDGKAPAPRSPPGLDAVIQRLHGTLGRLAPAIQL
uniref:collagen alpha-1(XI) chain-like n=1 Tax=Nyctereutes procyonoides TaxID=34880 RepID=UPI0024449847|nr:collagen alpha-1(XI) chain-like [Nyctereutes procyonoides]